MSGMSTGQVVGGIVGAVIGYFVPGSYVFIGAQLGMLAGGAIDPGKGPNTSGPRLADLTVQTSTYGAVIPRLYGTQAFTGNVFWLEGNAIKETPVKKKTGGKGGKPKSTQTTWVNTATFAVGLCKGPIAGVRRIWIKGELFYDAYSTDPSTVAASNAAAEGFEVYLGTNTQMPDPRIQADLGAANTPAWRGLAYIVFYDLNLAKYGETLMGAQVKVEVMKVVRVTGWSSTQTVLPASDSWGSMAASPSTAVCVAGDSLSSNRIAITRDGYTWEEKNTTASASRYCVAWGENIFIAMRSGSGCDKSTDDGDTWTQITSGIVDWTVSPLNAFPPLVSYGWSGIIYGTDRFCTVCSSHSATTDDGVYWRQGTMPAVRAWGPIAHNGSVFCTVAGGTNKAAVSADGLAWTEYTMAAVGNWSGMTYGAGLFVAVAFSGGSACQTSPDGITWTSRSLGGSNYKSVVWTGDYFFAVPYGGSTASASFDGITWVTTSMPVSATWRSACAYSGLVLGSVITSSIAAVIYPQRVGGGEILSSVVSSECLKSGILSVGDIHTSSLTSEVRGYLIGSQGSIRTSLEPLRASWPFDVVQHGYQLKFIPRGGSSVATIDADDLDARSGKRGYNTTIGRESEYFIPCKIVVKYADLNREYELGEQYESRMTTLSVNTETIDLPIVMTSAEAAGKAETLLYLRWLERFDIAFTIPATYNNLEPTDVVTLQTPEGDVSVRLTSINYTSDGRLECKGKYNSSAVYVPASVGSTPLVTGASTLPSPGPSSYVMLDVPYMHTAQADPSFLVSMWGADGWPGGVLMRTDDAGTTWNEVQAFTSPGGTSGTASNTIGSVDSRVWDKSSRLSLTLQAGDVFDATELAVLNGANHFAYGAHGRWEIIAVQKCTLVSGSSYTFSDMLRGRFGTEWAMTTHVAGDKVVALTSSEVTTIGMSAATIGLERTYRGVTYDQDISTATDYAFTYNGVNLECLSPVYFTGGRSTTTGDWSFSWVRRSRTDGEWRDLVDAGLGETTEAYQLDIFTDNTYSTVKRTITASTASCTYTAAQQTSDFGAGANFIYAKLYQMSSVVGRGYPLTAALSAPDGVGYTTTITVPSASVSSNLTDFPLALDLSLMSVAWWNSMWYTDGRDIRCFNSGSTPIPCDLVNLDYGARTGQLFVKTNLSSTVATVLYVQVGESGDGYVSPSDSIGRNNVWTNYHRVFTFGKDHVNRAGSQYISVNATTLSMDVVSTGPNTSSHQGVASDGAYYYVSHTNKITKYDMSWNVVATNNNPVGDVGGGVNHLGDIDVVDGIIYGAIENYVNISTYSYMKIARFDANTLAYIDSVDVSAQGHEVSSVTYCDRDGYLYVSSYADGSKLWRYNLNTLTYVSALTLSSTVNLVQGVTYWCDAFWLSSGYPNNTLYRVEYDGSVRPQIWNSTSPTADFEGLGRMSGSLLLLVDVYGSSNNGVVNTIKPKVLGSTPAVKMTAGSDQFEYQTGLTRYTTWTVGATVKLDSKPTNMAIVSYEVNGSTATTNRVTMAYRQSSDRFGLWNDTDGWLLDTVSPAVGTTYRLNASHNNTSGRKIYRNGGVAASAGTSTAKPGASADSILFGMENWAKLEDLDGSIGFAYIAPSLFSDAYVAAEYSNLTNPATFYTITG